MEKYFVSIVEHLFNRDHILLLFVLAFYTKTNTKFRNKIAYLARKVYQK